MESTKDGHVTFYTTLHLSTTQGMKSVTVKINPGLMTYTIPLSKYCKHFPHKVTKSGNPKQDTLQPTLQTWISHVGTPTLPNSSLKLNIRLSPNPFPPTSMSSRMRLAHRHFCHIQLQTNWESSSLKSWMKPFDPYLCSHHAGWKEVGKKGYLLDTTGPRDLFPAQWQSDIQVHPEDPDAQKDNSRHSQVYPL